MWYKLLLLLLYLIFLIIFARFLEIFSWYGALTQKIVNPMALSVSQLKALLDNRGVSFEGAVEKQDLVELVEATGLAVDEHSGNHDYMQIVAPVTNFTNGLHFLDEVEDKKDSVWLVWVKTDEMSGHFLRTSQWLELHKKLSRFGIRVGFFDCDVDRRHCMNKRWQTSRLILALPRDFTNKANITLYTFGERIHIRHILSWIKDKMASNVVSIRDNNDLLKWLTFNKNTFYEIRILFFAKLSILPLFFSALSFKFPGRIRFGVVTPNVSCDKAELTQFNATQTKRSNYVIVTNEKTYVYGTQVGEFLTFRYMERFLRSLRPEGSDIILTVLFLSNWLSWIEFITYQGNVIRRVMWLLWCFIKYNALVVASLLPLLAVFHLPYVENVLYFLLYLLRTVGLSPVSAILRKDFALYRDNTILFITASVIFSVIIALVEFIKHKNDIDRATHVDWFDFSQFRFSRTHLVSDPLNLPLHPYGIELVNEHLIYPSLWLHSSADCTYIKRLPRWIYRNIMEDAFILPEPHRSGDVLDCGWCIRHADKSPNRLPADSLESNSGHKLQVGENERELLETNSKTYNVEYTSTNAGQTKASTCSLTPVSQSPTTGCCTCPSSGHFNNSFPRGFLINHQCVICLDDYSEGSKLCGLPCRHSFHDECIVAWLSLDHHFCPVCRWPSHFQKREGYINHHDHDE